jgi:predicted HTH domain antitoxin
MHPSLARRALDAYRCVVSEDIRVAVEGPLDEEALRSATARAREAAILELYRLGRITSGRGAVLLGIERGEFLRLAAARGIPTVQLTPEELRDEVGPPGR